MNRVGSHEAKAKLPQLLDRVQEGESIIITRWGIPVAVLNPAPSRPKQDLDRVTKAILRARKGRNMGDMTICDAIRLSRQR